MNQGWWNEVYNIFDRLDLNVIHVTALTVFKSCKYTNDLWLTGCIQEEIVNNWF